MATTEPMEPAGELRPEGEPFARFAEWMAEAHAVDRERLPEPTAFALATVGTDGQPTARMILLKGVDARGFVFFTNYESRKGGELLATPKAGMCFHWQPLERQVRVDGLVEPVTEPEADAYFASRPRGSQIGAWASHQSRAMRGPDELAERVAHFEREFAGRDVPRPIHWSGFRVVPQLIEFWQGMPSRLHRRERYTRDGDGWRVRWIYP